MWMEGWVSAPNGRPHRKLEPNDVILFQESDVYFMSTACGRPQGGLSHVDAYSYSALKCIN